MSVRLAAGVPPHNSSEEHGRIELEPYRRSRDPALMCCTTGMPLKGRARFGQAWQLGTAISGTECLPVLSYCKDVPFPQDMMPMALAAEPLPLSGAAAGLAFHSLSHSLQCWIHMAGAAISEQVWKARPRKQTSMLGSFQQAPLASCCLAVPNST